MAKAKMQSPKAGGRVRQMLALFDLCRRIARQPKDKRGTLIRSLVQRLREIPQPYAG